MIDLLTSSTQIKFKKNSKFWDQCLEGIHKVLHRDLIVYAAHPITHDFLALVAFADCHLDGYIPFQSRFFAFANLGVPSFNAGNESAYRNDGRRRRSRIKTRGCNLSVCGDSAKFLASEGDLWRACGFS